MITIPPKQEFPPKKSDQCDDIDKGENDGGCGGPPPSQCPPSQNCGGNTGGGEAQTETPDEDCENIKTQVNNPNLKSAIENLNVSSNFELNYEKGFIEKNGNLIPTSTSPCADYISYTGSTDCVTGITHTHQKKRCDNTIVESIPSAGDVDIFIRIPILQAGSCLGNYSKAYHVTITSSGSYMLKYNEESFSITYNFNDWNTWYEENWNELVENDQASIDNQEKLFTKFLETCVGINGLEVYKIDGNNITKLN